MGIIGEICPEKACNKRGHHYIPQDYWDRAHADGAQPDSTLGQLIGDYLVVAPIGSGGFGKVFLALQSPIFRLKGALKLLEFPSDNVMLMQALMEKFQGEAEALADLSHPNIVKLLKYGIHARVPYLVMEFVDDAHTVRKEIQDRAHAHTSFTIAELQVLFDQILNALDAAHARNIIHRDVKPENIMVQSVVGNPLHIKVLDFGTAKFVENRADTKWPLGSPSYMAPEQVHLKGIGPWSDLYAVGVMLFELLTGRRPFPGGTENEIVAAKLNPDFDPFEPLRQMNFPDEVINFMKKALAREPEQRFRSASEVRVELPAVFASLESHPVFTAGSGAELTGLLDSSDFEDLEDLHSVPTRHASTPPPEVKSVVSHGTNRAETKGARLYKSIGVVLVGAIGVAFGVYYLNALDATHPDPPVAPEETTSQDIEDTQVKTVADDIQTADREGAQKDAITLAKDRQQLAERISTTPSEPALTSIAAGKFHTCVVLNGQVRCWGANFDGELGLGHTRPIGDKSPAFRAPFVDLGEPVLKVAAAGDRNASFSCAVLHDRSLRCWGSNGFGQLGLGHTQSVGDKTTPLSVPAVDLGGRAMSVSIGASQFGSHGCALLEGGLVKCWGSNKYGQLGYAHKTTIGDDESPSTLPNVELGGPASKVVVGKYHSCAILEDGKLLCWGWNNKGQLGYGNRKDVGDNETPRSVGAIKLDEAVKDIALGRQHTCALMESGKIRCWGWNSKGQLGLSHTKDIGDNEAVLKAKPIDIGGDVAQIVAGDNHTCALLVDGNVRCFGENNFGQLGYSHTRNIGDDEHPSIVGNVFLGENAVTLAAGSYHNCAILSSDTLRCWGHNKFGQLGYGHTNDIGDDETPVGAGNVLIQQDDNSP